LAAAFIPNFVASSHRFAYLIDTLRAKKVVGKNEDGDLRTCRTCLQIAVSPYIFIE
jgi:hypothetical protein